MIKFSSDLCQVSGFLQVLQFSPPIKHVVYREKKTSHIKPRHNSESQSIVKIRSGSDDICIYFLLTWSENLVNKINIMNTRKPNVCPMSGYRDTDQTIKIYPSQWTMEMRLRSILCKMNVSPKNLKCVIASREI